MLLSHVDLFPGLVGFRGCLTTAVDERDARIPDHRFDDRLSQGIAQQVDVQGEVEEPNLLGIEPLEPDCPPKDVLASRG